MRLSTLNVNSIRKRAPLVRQFLDREQPDLLFLQELKCKTEEFPGDAFADSGYRCHAVGQHGGRNGVAVLSKVPFEVVAEALPGEDDDNHARYLEVDAGGTRIAGIYLPNGNSGGADGYAYKLRWIQRLATLAAERLESGGAFAILGDFNVCPTSLDLAPGALPPTDALIRPESRSAFRTLIHLGLTDAVRALHPEERLYTYWDYGAAFEGNRGLRIDHALLSAELAERLDKVEIDLPLRAQEQPSDHTAVTVSLR